MVEQFFCIDPVKTRTDDFHFDDVRYFHVNHLAKENEVSWLIWTDGTVDVSYYGLFYDELNDSSYEELVTETKTKIKGMIEFQQSPYEKDVIWLKFFEVTPDFKGQGFSKQMIAKLVDVFSEKYPGKILSRSSASDEGKLKLKERLTEALNASQIKFKFS
jgi:GNAT superfamily N-acetyltransferase